MIDRWQGSFDTVIWKKEPSNEAGGWSRVAEEGIWKEDTSNQAGGSQVVREGMYVFPWVPDESRAAREVLYSTFLALRVILRGRTKYRGHAGGFHGRLLGWSDSIRSWCLQETFAHRSSQPCGQFRFVDASVYPSAPEAPPPFSWMHR
jgi:hypothetical protein